MFILFQNLIVIVLLTKTISFSFITHINQNKHFRNDKFVLFSTSNLKHSNNNNAKKLSKTELKIKEQLDATKAPRIERIHEKSARVPLTHISAGQKLKGRIISIQE